MPIQFEQPGFEVKDPSTLGYLRKLQKQFELNPEGWSGNTWRALRSDLNGYLRFCRDQSYLAIPVEIRAVNEFLWHLHSKGKKHSTLLRCVNSLKRLQLALGLHDPDPDQKLKQTLKEIGLQSEAPKLKSRPITFDEVTDIRQNLRSSDNLTDLRNLVILGLAFESLLRGSEITQLEAQNIRRTPEGDAEAWVEPDADKGVKGGTIYLSPETMIDVDRWTEVTGIQEGYLLRAVSNQGVWGDGLTSETVRQAMHAISPEGTRITAQSGRIGACIEMLQEKIDPDAIQHAGRWHRKDMISRYARSLEHHGMAQLIKSKEHEETQS